MEEFLMIAAESLLGGAKLFSESSRADTQDLLLDTQLVQEKEKGVQQTERDQSQIAKVLDTQKSQESVSGLTGPSFGAISKTSFDAFLNDENAISLNTQFRESAIKARKSDVNKSRNASMFGTLANLGMDTFKIIKAP